MLLMLLVVVPMATPAIKKRVSFEFRFNLHWLLLPMAFALCWHSPRVLILTLIAVGLWALDYTYVLVFRTFRLDVVELTRLPDGGVQMLFHNPTGFEPHAGEFIKVKFPWLEQGGDEWHPFSFYMREATAEGLSAARPSIAGKLSLPMGAGKSGRSRVSVQGEDAQFSRAMSELSMGDSSTLMSQEVRNDEPEYTTTQCFIMPAGDWTKSLSEAVKNRGGAARNRSCWVRGPYPSPFAIAADFSQLVLFASGIGITPALAVMGQYRGNDRMKFMVWATRSPHMLKFFAPLLSDAQVATVYYTGKEKLTPAQINQIRSSCDGNLFIHQKRPEWDKVLGKHILTFENSAAQGSHTQLCDRVEDLPPQAPESSAVVMVTMTGMPMPPGSAALSTQVYANGDKYEGDFDNSGQRHGQGTFTWATGDTYSGQFMHGKKHGAGSFTQQDGSRYVGEWNEDAMHGVGTFTYDNGETYEGQWTDNQVEGTGTWRYADGSVYIGQFAAGMKSGQGKYTLPSGDVADGTWVDDALNGHAKMNYRNGNEYSGEWVDNAKSGQGTLQFASGAVFEGAFEGDQRNGRGKLTAADGTVYEGEFKNAKKHGQGKFTFPRSGATYEGQWADDKMNGFGRYNFSDKSVYEGAFKDDLMHGDGQKTWADGNKYDGQWENDMRHGSGTFSWVTTTTIYAGDWVRDKRHGRGKLTLSDGTVQEGPFENNEFVG